MSKQTEALKLALEALSEIDGSVKLYHRLGPDWTHKDGTEVFEVSVLLDRSELIEKAIAALREALALVNEVDQEQPAQQQEPVAVVSGYYGGQCVVLPTNPAMLFNSGTAFYTSPPASKPLTDEEIDKLMPYCNNEFDLAEFRDFARAIEAKLKEKNSD